MSPIFGIVDLNGDHVPRPHIAAMASALACEPIPEMSTWGGGPAIIGHLGGKSTSNDEDDRQPVVDTDPELCLVVDGRLDNRRDLYRLLGITARDASSLLDSALVRRAYERWGKQCLRHVIGELTVAVWDGRSRELLLACSAPLSRPLVYSSSAGRFVFASQPRGLFALPGLTRCVDELAVVDLLSSRTREERLTLFSDVHRVVPGESLTVDRHGTRIERWWQPDLANKLRLSSSDEYVAAFDELFERVIADHLPANGQIGVMLSGGLDSGAVAAMVASRLASSGRSLRTYTEVPPAGFSGPVALGRDGDESGRVACLATMHPNVCIQLIDGSQRGLLDGIDDYLSYAEMPFVNAANRGWIEAILSRAAQDGVRVLLTGDQGNLTASWDGAGLLSELLRQGRVGRAVREARALARAGRSQSTGRALARLGILPLLPDPVSRGIWSLAGRPGVRSGADHMRPLINDRWADWSSLSAARRPHGDLADGGRAMRLRVLRRTGMFAAQIYAAYAARFGVDVRTPLADRRLVEFCLAVPEEQYMTNGQPRLLIRRAMAGRLPQDTLAARRRGLQAAAWFESMSAERTALLAEVQAFEADGLTSQILDLPRMRTLLERWPRERPVDAGGVALYRGQLALALVTGRFLLWAQAN